MYKSHYDLMQTTEACTEVVQAFRKELDNRVVSFDEFGDTRVIQEVAAIYSRDPRVDDAGGINVAAHMYYHIYHYDVVPGRTYIIGDDISRLLLNTNVDIESDILQMPFQSIIILPPEGLIQVYNHKTGNHPLYHIYVHMEEQSTYRYLRICCVGRENAQSKNLFDDAVYYFKIKLETGKILPQLKAQLKEWELAIDDKQLIQSTLEEIAITQELFTYVINTILYITSADAEIREVTSIRSALIKRLGGVKNVAKRRKLQKQIDRQPRERQFLVGGSFQLSEDDRHSMDKRHGKLGVQFWVSGHWRSQPYGPQSKLRRPCWIKPFKKGPDMAELIHSVGVIK